MNNDGVGFMGAGASDMRMEGSDLQHHIQHEMTRHRSADTHRQQHLAKHYGRSYDSQHGHDTHKY